MRVLATGVHGNVKPDDIAVLGSALFVGFQNGVGSKGEAAKGTGATTSTIVEYVGKRMVKSWSIAGKCDGLGANPSTGNLIATVNEDGSSSMYTIHPATNTVTHYTYNVDPTSLGGGGTDAITVVDGKILISGSAPNTGTAPAVYAVTLDSSTSVATLTTFFKDNASAKSGTTVAPLALTDPDSSTLVPSSSPVFGGDFALNSQGDQKVIFASHVASGHPELTMLPIGAQIDDLTWATSTEGSLYMTDNTTGTIYQITGDFTPGTAFVDTASDSNVPGMIATLNLTTGQLMPVLVGFSNPHGLMFVPSAK